MLYYIFLYYLFGSDFICFNLLLLYLLILIKLFGFFLIYHRGKLSGDYSCGFAMGDEPFGVHLKMEETEYELGWLCFSGKKHDFYKDSDELVAIVYDGAYCNFQEDEGQVSKELYVENELVE